jgi:hypothetical protein
LLQINLTPQEATTLHGFIYGVLEVVEEKSELQLPNKERTTAVMTNILDKLHTELHNPTTN